MALLERTAEPAARRTARLDLRARSAWLLLGAFLALTVEEWLWGTARLDAAITRALEHPDTRLLDRISSLFSLLGDVPLTAGLIALAVVLLWRRGNTRGALALGAAFAVALLVEGALKIALHHPDVPNPLSPPWAPGPPNSFPSGHVLRAALLGTAAVLLWPERRTRLVAFCFVVLVGYTRIYSGAHWTSDVLGGALLAWALHVAVTAYARARPIARR